MICPVCDYGENPPEATDCELCGSALEPGPPMAEEGSRSCPRGHLNPAGSRFCGSCGAPLAPPTVEGPTPLAPEPVGAEPEQPPVPAGEICLRHVSGQLRIRLHQAPGTTLQLGRGAPGEGVDIDLQGLPESHYVSRRHARLHIRPDHTVAVEDTGSSNGTYLNQRRLQPGDLHPLRIGDRLELGKGAVVFEVERW